jgi:hypothetical protein
MTYCEIRQVLMVISMLRYVVGLRALMHAYILRYSMNPL